MFQFKMARVQVQTLLKWSYCLGKGSFRLITICCKNAVDNALQKISDLFQNNCPLQVAADLQRSLNMR